MTKREKIEDRLKAEKPIPKLFEPDPIFEMELARRMSRQSVHYGARILAESSHYMTEDDRPTYTLIISSLMNLRNRLDELSPLAKGGTQ